jgi:hypothetical protein
MGPWSIVAAVLAALAILILVAYGGNEDDFSGRERAAVDNRAAQELVALPVALGADPALTIVIDRQMAPEEVAALLQEARDLVATAAGQPPDQAKATLQQAIDKLDTALDEVDQAADDTSNDVVRIRLLQLHRVLERVKDVLEDKVDQL